MEKEKTKRLIGLILTNLDEFEGQYSSLHHTERDEINHYLSRLDDDNYMKQVKKTIEKWYYDVPPHSPPPWSEFE